MTHPSLVPGLAAAWLFLAPVLPAAAQTTVCPIVTDTTASQAIGSPLSGKVEVAIGGLTLCSFSGGSTSGRTFGVSRETAVFGPGEGGVAALARRYIPELPDAVRAEIEALQQAGMSVALPDYQFEAVGGVGDAALWVKTQLVPGIFKDSLLVQQGSDAYAFDVDDSPDAQTALIALAQAVLANPASASIRVNGGWT